MFYINSHKGAKDMSGIVRRAVAGTLESSDAYVEIGPGGSGVQLEIESVVEEQFGESIRQSVMEVLASRV